MPQDQMEALKRLYPARMLLTGNAFSRDGEFFDSHHTKRHIYAGVTVSVYDTPNFTGENGGAPGMPTEEDVEERKLDWGEDHPLYQGSILARFPDMLDDSLLSRSAIEAAVARWHGDDPSPEHPHPLEEAYSPPRPLGEGNAVHRVGEGCEGDVSPPRPLGEGNAVHRVGEGCPDADCVGEGLAPSPETPSPAHFSALPSPRRRGWGPGPRRRPPSPPRRGVFPPSPPGRGKRGSPRG